MLIGRRTLTAKSRSLRPLPLIRLQTTKNSSIFRPDLKKQPAKNANGLRRSFAQSKKDKKAQVQHQPKPRENNSEKSQPQNRSAIAVPAFDSESLQVGYNFLKFSNLIPNPNTKNETSKRTGAIPQ